MSVISKADDDRFLEEIRQLRVELLDGLPRLRWMAELGPRPEREDFQRLAAETEILLDDIRISIEHLHR